jgi:hypothetical protein
MSFATQDNIALLDSYKKYMLLHNDTYDYEWQIIE